MKKVISILFVFMLGFSAIFAQQPSASIQVIIQNESGAVLEAVTGKLTKPGSSVVVAEYASGADGSLRFSGLESNTAYILEISFSGYATQKLNLTAGQDNAFKTVQMQQQITHMDAVIVTALGIRKAEKAVGYAAQSINTEDVNDARSNNFVHALSGKVAGLSLISAGSGPLNSTRISLRGDASLDPNGNNALIVLDGVPMNSDITSSGVSSAYGAGSGNDVPIDFGNSISDINPDDIENISVLKGPAATALYGSRASGGALLITTKSGRKGSKGLGITVNSNFSLNDVLKWPDFQHEYGQGNGSQYNADGIKYYSYGNSEDGNGTHGTSSAYGPRFDGQMYYQYDPELQGQAATRSEWKPYKNNVKDFWRTGHTITNNIALAGGNENGNARASITHSKNEWMMPNTGYERISAALSMNFKVSERLKMSAKVNYTNKKSDNLPATGYNNQSISYFMIFQNPNVDLSWYRPIWKKDKYKIDQIHPYSSFIDNPYLIAYEMTNAIKSNQIVGNLSANYTISKHLELMVRSSINVNADERNQRRPYSTANFKNGFYKEQNINYSEVNSDLLLTYKSRIGKSFSLTSSVGANAMTYRYNHVQSQVIGLVIPDVYMLSNGIGSPTVAVSDKNKNVNSVYGLATLGWKDKIFLDVTGRNDWSSTLPTQNNSFFYPSINNSIVWSDLVQLPEVVSFAKTRLSYAMVGNDTDPYQTQKYYGTSTFPSSGSVPTTLHNIDFKPEISTSIEAGLDLRFFKNRLMVDITGYHNITKNQILQAPVDPTSGYSRAVVNGGKIRNKGVELVLSAKPIATKNFEWNTGFTWAKNFNTVLELTEGMDDRQDIGYGGNATIQARVGGTTGDIYGFGFLRNDEGSIIYNSNGLPARPAEIQYIGSAYADWKAGFRNEVSYKNFRFSVLFDGQYGGIVYSQTHHKMSEQGKLKHTLMGREDDFIIGNGVVMGTDGKYVPNTVKVKPNTYYSDYYRRANVESNSFDASFLKLREVRIEYSFAKKLIQKTAFEQVTVALYGRDLLMFTNFPMFDPETAALNGSTLLPGVEIGQMPSQRTFGANITLKL